MDRLDALEAYTRLVERGSFSAVARELRVQQSTVSKWLAALESQLGVQLIERTTRRHRVTEAGQHFYERARDLLAHWEATTAELQSGSQIIRGRLKISAPVVFGQRYVSPLMPAFADAHPELEIELSFADRYINLLEDGVDVAVRVGRPVDSSDRARALAVTPRRLVASPDYLAHHKAPMRPADLAHHRCLLHSGLSTGAVWTFTRSSGRSRQQATVQGRFAANHSETLLHMALAGHGVALLASWLVDDAIEAGDLVPLLPDFEAPPAPIQALMPPTRHVAPRVRAFVEHLAADFGGRWGVG